MNRTLETSASAGPQGPRVARGTGGLLLVIVTATVLAACGGGSSGGDSPAPGGGISAGPGSAAKSDVPPEATASVGGMIAWMKSWIGSGNDAAQPMAIGAARLPVDDGAAPVAIR